MPADKDSEIGAIRGDRAVRRAAAHQVMSGSWPGAKEVPAASTIVVHPLRRDLAARPDRSGRKPGIIVSDPDRGRPRRFLLRFAREHGLRIDGFEIVDRAPQRGGRDKGGSNSSANPKGELLMKGSLHTDELMREVTSGKTGPAHRAADQSRLHYGCADLCRDNSSSTDAAINIFSRSRYQGADTSSQNVHRPVHAGRPSARRRTSP